jgi:membrane-associated phospholipid phosphatase
MSNPASNRDIAIGASWIALAAGTYELLNHIGRSQLIDLSTPLDRQIPVVPVFVIPYLSFIPLVFLVIPWMAVKSRDVFRSFALSVFISQMILNPLYLLVPATVPRPELASNDIFSTLLRDLVWKADEPLNTFPSNHVTLSVIAILALARLPYARRVVLPLQLWLGLVCLSTMFVHQHIIWDVLSGIVIGSAVYWLVSRRMNSRGRTGETLH